MANHDDTTPTLSQLLYTREKLENLARGALSRPVVEQIENTATGVLLEIGKTPANSWSEFHRKLAALLGDYIDSSIFLDIIREDTCRLVLGGESAEAAQVLS
jgi:hypothetical protein